MATCKNCHFLSFEKKNHLEHKVFHSLEQKKRVKIPCDFPKDILCYFGIWSEEVDQKNVEISKKRNVDQCFFRPYKPGMSLRAAEVLQKREEERKNLNAAIKRSILSVRIAIAAIVLNFVLLLFFLTNPIIIDRGQVSKIVNTPVKIDQQQLETIVNTPLKIDEKQIETILNASSKIDQQQFEKIINSPILLNNKQLKRLLNSPQRINRKQFNKLIQMLSETGKPR